MIRSAKSTPADLVVRNDQAMEVDVVQAAIASVVGIDSVVRGVRQNNCISSKDRFYSRKSYKTS